MSKFKFNYLKYKVSDHGSELEIDQPGWDARDVRITKVGEKDGLPSVEFVVLLERSGTTSAGGGQS